MKDKPVFTVSLFLHLDVDVALSITVAVAYYTSQLLVPIYPSTLVDRYTQFWHNYTTEALPALWTVGLPW